MIRFDVLGVPAPKGSGRAMLLGGKARFIASGSTVNQRKLKSWDVAVREAARDAVGPRTTPLFVQVPIALVIVFRQRRPAGHYHKKTGALLASAPLRPITKPDSSKTLRATEDSLTGIVWDDDARVVETFVRKEYAVGGNEGATICVDEWKPTV